MRVQSIDARGRHVTEEPDRFGALFFAHAPRLVRLAGLLGDDDPEDVVQDPLGAVRRPRPTTGRRREGGRLPEQDRGQRGAQPTTTTPGGAPRRAPAHHGRHGNDPTAVHDDRQAVVEALAGVSARQREALVLRFWMDLPLAAIADAMGVRIGTLKLQTSRGLDVVGGALREEAER